LFFVISWLRGLTVVVFNPAPLSYAFGPYFENQDAKPT